MKLAEVPVYLGTFTQPHLYFPGSCGAGIVGCALDLRTGRLEQRSITGGILSPTYLAIDERGDHLFAITCDVDASCHVQAYQRQADGSLTATNAQPIGARVGCHICSLAVGRVCAVSYFDSSIAVFPVSNGQLGPCEFQVRYHGSSVNPARQDASHAHQAVVSPDGRGLYVCDLGTDRIWRHALSGGSVAGGEPSFTKTPPGCGPRHLVFHPKLPTVYVICELNARVLTYEWQPDSGALVPVAETPSLPKDWQGEPAGAAIRVHPTGSVLYVSNRNHDSLTAFTLDQDGQPTPVCHIPSGGVGPRDFAIDPSGRWLLAAHQLSNNVAIHELDPASGLPTGHTPVEFAVKTPACVLFAPTS